MTVSTALFAHDVIGGMVGGTIGGVIGNQFGEGNGKIAATIAGAALGAMIGSEENGHPYAFSEKGLRESSRRLMVYEHPKIVYVTPYPAYCRGDNGHERRQYGRLNHEHRRFVRDEEHYVRSIRYERR
ncbi:MAG: glycine zipper 2TM domain-containing protein [Sulfuricurvum sp.]|nr:glycine zipper 2TM domain-containing protein [Sulfuricurvum sp.]